MGGSVRQGRQASAHALEDLHEDTAESKGHHRSQLRRAPHADKRLATTGDHLLHGHHRRQAVAASQLAQLVDGGLEALFVDAQTHRPVLGSVRDVGEFHHIRARKGRSRRVPRLDDVKTSDGHTRFRQQPHGVAEREDRPDL